MAAASVKRHKTHESSQTTTKNVDCACLREGVRAAANEWRDRWPRQVASLTPLPLRFGCRLPQGGRSVFMHTCTVAVPLPLPSADERTRSRGCSWSLCLGTALRVLHVVGSTGTLLCSRASPLHLPDGSFALLRSSSASGQPSTAGRGSILHRMDGATGPEKPQGQPGRCIAACNM